MKVTDIWAGKEIEIPQDQDSATGKMSKLNWKSYFPLENDTRPMHIEQTMACNKASKPGATDKAMLDLLERVGCD